MDWDSDPELKAIRDEFMGSFPERIRNLNGAKENFQKKQWEKGWLSLRDEVHRLAGAAASYGFPHLSRVGGMIDDYCAYFFDRERVPPEAAVAIGMCDLMVELLSVARTGIENTDYEGDGRWKEIISVYESLPSEARP